MQNPNFTLNIKKSFLSKNLCASFLNIVFILVFSYLFSSCRDNVINVDNTGYDTARYKWEIDTISAYQFQDAVFVDTNKIFFLTTFGLYEYDGINYIPHNWSFSFSGYCISGADENNIYIGGTKGFPNNREEACIRKWNGAGFDDYIIADTSDNAGYFHSIYSRSYNEHWLSSTRGRVYKFDGNDFQGFYFDTNYWYIDPFLNDGAGNIYFASKIYYNNPLPNTQVEMHKYNGTSWQTVYSVNMSGDAGGTFFTANIGNQIYSIVDEHIRLFNGSSFSNVINTENFVTLDLELCGSSPGNIFVNGFIPENRADYIMNYNGIKWSREIEEKEDTYNFHYFYSSDNMVYAIAYNYTLGKSIVLKGVRK